MKFWMATLLVFLSLVGLAVGVVCVIVFWERYLPQILAILGLFVFWGLALDIVKSSSKWGKK